MIEAVGEEYWPTYFRRIDGLLAPGGARRASRRSSWRTTGCSRPAARSAGSRSTSSPAGSSRRSQAIDEVTAATAPTCGSSGSQAFGADYAETLRRWRETFLAQWPSIDAQGFDETFRRMWEFYLAYCEAGFATHYLDVAQIRLARRDSR